MALVILSPLLLLSKLSWELKDVSLHKNWLIVTAETRVAKVVFLKRFTLMLPILVLLTKITILISFAKEVVAVLTIKILKIESLFLLIMMSELTLMLLKLL